MNDSLDFDEPRGRGDNLPPENADPLLDRLTECTAELVREYRVDSLIESAETCPEIISEEEAKKATSLAGLLRDAKAAFEKTHKIEKAPFLESGRKVDNHFKGFIVQLDGLFKAVVAKVDVYQKEKERRANEERRRKELEAQRQREEAERKAREARSAEERAAAAAAAEKAKEAAQEAQKIDARTRSDHGQLATSRKVWRHKVTDYKALPDLVMQNERVVDAIDKVIAGLVRGGVREIPGVDIWADTETLIR